MTRNENMLTDGPWLMSNPRALWLALALVNCGADARPCQPYACNTTAQMTHDFASDADGGDFDVRVCHGELCDDLVLTLTNESRQTCEGVFESSACVEPTETGFAFRASWIFDEGLPSERNFSLRIVDRTNGELLLDETREAQFVHGEMYDHCHDCWSSTMNLDEPG